MSDTLVTLRPNATAGGGGWTVTGAASAHAATSDDSDASYVDASTATPGSAVTLDFATATVPSLAVIHSVTPRVRASQATGTESYVAQLANPGIADVLRPTSTITTYTGVARTKNNSGGAWTQTDINGARLQIRSTGGSNNPDDLRVYEAYLDVRYNQAPVATVTGPTGAPGTSRPPVTWTYSDPEGDAEERYRVKIFSAAQYGAGGFNPETSTATWDSGAILLAALTATPTTDLVNGVTYKAYVKVADVGSSGRYGSWDDGSAFTVTLSPPATPTLDATADNTNARISLAVTNNDAASGSILVERSIDAGATWAAVRGGSFTLAPAATTTIYDYEAPTGISVQYRAALTIIVSGDVLVSAFGTDTATLALVSSWLKDPTDPTRNVDLDLQLPLRYKRRNRTSVLDTLGAELPISRSDGTKGEEGDATIVTVGQDEHDDLDLLLGSGRTLLLQIPAGERQRYLAVASDADTTVATLADSTTSYRETSFSWVEVAAP